MNIQMSMSDRRLAQGFRPTSPRLTARHRDLHRRGQLVADRTAIKPGFPRSTMWG
jgi:hypothetical protein